MSGKSKLFCYSFYLSFDHAPSTDALKKVFDSVVEKYSDKLPKKPEYVIQGIGAFETRYMFYPYVKNPKDIFTIQPSFIQEIIDVWEKAKKK